MQFGTRPALPRPLNRRQGLVQCTEPLSHVSGERESLSQQAEKEGSYPLRAAARPLREPALDRCDTGRFLV
jgi:hypothetical protein